MMPTMAVFSGFSRPKASSGLRFAAPLPRRLDLTSPNTAPRLFGRRFVRDVIFRILPVGHGPAKPHHPCIKIFVTQSTNRDDPLVAINIALLAADCPACDVIGQGPGCLLSTASALIISTAGLAASGASMPCNLMRWPCSSRVLPSITVTIPVRLMDLCVAADAAGASALSHSPAVAAIRMIVSTINRQSKNKSTHLLFQAKERQSLLSRIKRSWRDHKLLPLKQARIYSVRRTQGSSWPVRGRVFLPTV